MVKKLNEIIRFQNERLFNGAVNLDWFLDNPERAQSAADAFVFHGPTYHGVTQEDVGDAHGHQLQDTASFTHSIIRSCVGLTEKPFTLTIAGYGTGKSHLALTLAQMLGIPDSKSAISILSSLKNADKSIGDEIEGMLKGMGKPCLVLALNGMRNFDLTAEISQQILIQLRERGLDTTALDNLRPRFTQAANLVRMSNQNFLQELLNSTEATDREAILDQLDSQDEQTYEKVQQFFEHKGMPIRVLGGESLKDLIDVACHEYCGSAPDKPFACLLVLFDEFGRYAEFATMKRQIAGSGVLQHLFEGIQSNSDKACFVGFIQFELNTYVQRIVPELKNDIIRVTTRYQTSDKAYLSTNLETLIAHLIEKKSPIIDEWFDTEEARRESAEISDNIQKWFPLSHQHRLWGIPDHFHTVIRKGCWPLSPYAAWLLYYLTAAGQHLQERSALFLLANAIDKYQERPAEKNGQAYELSASDLWSEELLQEFIASEESGQQGTIAHSYATVLARHGSQLNNNQIALLRTIVLAVKLGLSVSSRDDATSALSRLSGIAIYDSENALNKLQNEYNVIEWDDSFHQFDILGDAVPRTHFLAFLRQRVASAYDEQGKSDLFVSRISEWCDSIKDLECDFAEMNSITTKEWRYQHLTSNLNMLPNHIKFAAENWRNALSVSEPRGTIIYCYVELSQETEKIETDASKLLRHAAKEMGQSCLPIMVVLIVDENAQMGRIMAELAVLSDLTNEQDKARFGNLIGAHEEKIKKLLADYIEKSIRERRYVTGLRTPLEAGRLGRVGTELFSSVYGNSIPFPFDGFSTTRGNAADSCMELTTDLLNGRLDYESCGSKPPKVRNRALAVLKEKWQCFGRDGSVTLPKHSATRSLVQAWRRKLDADDQQFIIANELRTACLPPYGANLASAGLLLGIFFAPRRNNVFVVDSHGSQLDVGQWLQKDIFRSKLIDLDKIAGTELINIGEVSAEWERLLEDWEQAEIYREIVQYYNQARELKERVPIPPMLSYKYIHLEEIADRALQEIKKVEDKSDKAWDKIDKGYHHGNASRLSWGAADLVHLRDNMEAQIPVWQSEDIKNIDVEIGKARQMVIQVFPEWLTSQTLRTDNPDEVGNFKHRLGTLTCKNLELLNLEDEAKALKERVDLQIRNSQTQAEAHRLVQEVDSWLTEHSEVLRIVRVAEIRTLLKPGQGFARKLQGLARRVNLPELDDVRTRLSSFTAKLKKAEADLMKRATKLWNSKIRSCDDLEPLNQEVSEIERIFEGCERDLEDIRGMRRILRIYQDCYSRLDDKNLSWKRFESLVGTLKSEAEKDYGDEDPPPWDIHETLELFAREISKSRKIAGKEWLSEIESVAATLDSMDVKDADAVFKKASSPPSVATPQQCENAARVAKKAEQRCHALQVDWLVQRYSELPDVFKQIFLQKIE